MYWPYRIILNTSIFSSVFITSAAFGQDLPQLPQCENVVIENIRNNLVESGLLGNGGDALVRKNAAGQREFAMLLDFYEGKLMRPALLPKLGDENASLFAMVSVAISQFDQVDHLRAQRYREWLSEFAGQACFASGISLRDIDDSQHLHLPIGDGWGIEQVAIHSEPVVTEQPRYIINYDIWTKMDKVNQAGLILHELIYRDAIADEVKTSKHIRSQVLYAASERLESMTIRTYVDHINRLGMKTLSHKGAWLMIDDQLQFRDDDTIKQGMAVWGSRYDFPWGSVGLKCLQRFDDPYKNFTIMNKGSPEVKIGSIEISLASRLSDNESCDDGGADLVMQNSENLNQGYVKIRVPDDATVYSNRPGEWSFYLGRVLDFVDGQLIAAETVNLFGKPRVTFFGVRCFLRQDSTVRFGSYPVPVSFELEECSIPLIASVAVVTGAADVYKAPIGVKADVLRLAHSQLLQVNVNNSNEGTFSGLLDIWPDGSIKAGNVINTYLKDSDAKVHYVKEGRVEFDESGYVTTLP